jgi:NADH:ubiquinone oxidoreductase subunit K
MCLQLATDLMFWSGLLGAVVFRRNLIVMLLATEIVMLACNLNFLFAAAYLNDMTVRSAGSVS